VMHDLGERSGFPIRPLMLRHTYAIYTLLMLRTNPNFKGEPLMYVRDRLGHSSVQTTLVYLKQIERLSGGEVLSIINEYDQMFDLGFLRATVHNVDHGDNGGELR
jgi:integrase/recombinase XerD